MLCNARKPAAAVMSAAVSFLALAPPAQAIPWVQYVDAQSDSVCEVVNAANVELVVLASTGELVAVTDVDVVFADTFVDGDGLVSFLGAPAGYIEFAEDADGFRTLWWFTDANDVANVNLFTGEPTSSLLLPIDFGEVPCDACPFWDVPAECLDSDGDGVEDAFDLCDATPFDEVPGEDGCSCSQLDNDLDGLDDCIDLCPNTPLDLVPGADGCACEELDGDGDGINSCFDICPNTPLDEAVDIDGCSCSQVDDDGDGVVNCFDLCEGTPLTAVVNSDGCAIVVAPGGGTVINLCGSFGATLFAVMLCGLAGMRQSLRRR